MINVDIYLYIITMELDTYWCICPKKINTDNSIQYQHIKQNITGAVQICIIYNATNVVYLVTGVQTFGGNPDLVVENYIAIFAVPVAVSEIRVGQRSICDIWHHHALWCLICSINNA